MICQRVDVINQNQQACTTDTDCPTGTTCQGGQCVPNKSDNTSLYVLAAMGVGLALFLGGKK